MPAYHQGVEIDALLAAGYTLRYYGLDEQLRVDLADVAQRLDDTVSALDTSSGALPPTSDPPQWPEAPRCSARVSAS